MTVYCLLVHEQITSLGRVGLISPKTTVQKVQGNYLMTDIEEEHFIIEISPIKLRWTI